MAEKKYTKLGILMFFVLIVATLMLATDIFRFTNSGLDSITRKNEEMRCINLRYSIDEVQYNGERLIFEITSQSYNYNISRISLNTDNNDVREITLDSPILGGGSKLINVNNVNITERFYVYPDECDSNGKNVSI